MELVKKGMKRQFLIIACALLLACSACVPTPEEDAVREKNSEKMIEMAKGSEQMPELTENGKAEETGTAAEAAPVPVKDQMPERLSWDFYTDTKNIHVTADVPIRIMTEGSFPLLRVMQKTGNPEENVKIARSLLGTETVYKSVYQLTRQDLEKEISDLMENLSDPMHNKNLLEDFTVEELENELIPRWQEHLEELQEQYRTFQDGEIQPNPVWDGQPEGQTVLVAGAYDKDDARKYDHIYFTGWEDPPNWSIDMNKKGEWGSAWDYGVMELIDPKDYDTPHAGTAMTPKEAAQKVQAVLDPFVQTEIVDILWGNNASDTYGSDGTRLRWGYIVRLTPVYYGTAAGIGFGQLFMGDRDPVTNVNRFWNQEYIMGAVNESGILTCEWRDPLQVTEVITEHASLLPFEEIERIAKRQMNRILSYGAEENSTLEVTDVRLGLLYLMEQYSTDSGLMVPCWIFRKTQNVSEEQMKLWNREVSSFDYDWLNPLVIINAVDGSVIDPWAGH